MRSILLPVFLLSILSGCSVIKYEDVSYLNVDMAQGSPPPTLNIFTSKKAENANAPVLVFVHGGNWNSGKKELYNFYGRNFARKGVTTVIVGYTLSPAANYDDMASQTAKAIEWTQANISNYNGDPSRLFLTGHSAGGHLLALATMNPKYGIDAGSISGIILNDAAGLDMHHYLQQNKPTEKDNYLTTWTNDPETWKKASPINYLNKDAPPFMIYLGEKTYQSITTANTRFLKALKTYQPGVEPIMLDKKHVPMMTQYIWPWSKRYGEIIEFMDSQ